MNSIVIVALPPVGDRVNKVSSEKEAHLTLLYLGDVDLSAEAILYVQHACAELSPFGLSVDYRGELGEDKADVLFFEKRPWDMDRVKEFMHHLLLNDEIKRAYDSADQFPEWTPHLTLGYPEAPANEDDDDDKRFHYLDFDRIAVWTGDFEGPEFRLKYDDYGMDVAMSDISTVERGVLAAAAILSGDPASLKQYGKKGMKWGVRNDAGHEGEAVKTKKLEKLDKKWEQEMANGGAYMKLYNKAADKMNDGGIDAINNSPKWKDVDFTKPENASKLDEYYAEHEAAFQKAMIEAGPSLGMNPSGTKRFVIRQVIDPETGEPYDDVFLDPVDSEVKHAEGEKSIRFRLKRNDTGHITEYVAEEITLKHYGVKGMKWGVTTVDKAGSVTKTSEKKALLGPKDITVSQRRAGKHVTAKGGQRQTATPEAIKAAAGRQKAKKSTTDALTNDELADTIKRMQLETQFTKLSRQTARQNLGRKFAEALLGNEIMNMKVEPKKGKK